MYVVVEGCSLRDIFDELKKPCGQILLHSQRIISRTGFLKKKLLFHFFNTFTLPSSTTNDIILVNTSIHKGKYFASNSVLSHTSNKFLSCENSALHGNINNLVLKARFDTYLSFEEYKRTFTFQINIPANILSNLQYESKYSSLCS